MTVAEAFKAWQDTRELVLSSITPDNMRVRVRAWDRYCAIRDGFTIDHYAYRRERYGNPKITDASMRFRDALSKKENHDA